MRTPRLAGASGLPGFILLVLVWGCAGLGRAQEPVPTPSPDPLATPATVQLAGQVLDPQGAVAPGVSVTALNLKTALQWQVTTDAEGRFLLSNLPPGDYQVKVAAAGFATKIVDRVHVGPSFMKQSLVIRLAGGPVPVVTPSLPQERNFAVFDWDVSSETELLQRLESMAETGWALAFVLPMASRRGFFHFDKADGARYELLRQNEPLKVEDLRRQIEQRPDKRLVGAHRLDAGSVLLIFRSAP